MGEKTQEALKLQFDRRLRLEFHRGLEQVNGKGADRAAIASCSELGLGLEDFLALGVEAMQGVAPDLGL